MLLAERNQAGALAPANQGGALLKALKDKEQDGA
jgi:hypothetical protein